MISKKVCMVGAFAVGKTSLVRRFVDNLYDDGYLTTVGVKIDRKVVETDSASVNIMLWDLAGEDAFTDIRMDYLRGASGYILVVDGTRAHTLDVALSLRHRVQEEFGDLPCVLALNKSDLEHEWVIDMESVEALEVGSRWSVVRTSALTGDSVEHLFSNLADDMVRK